MKLGFRLIDVDTADQTRLLIGEGEWTSHTDITNFQQAFEADHIPVSDTETFLLFFRYIPEGMLLGFARRLNGDRGPERSNKTLWVFFPNKISVNTQQLTEIISACKHVLVEKTTLRSVESFETLAPKVLTQDYPELERPFYTGAMKGTVFAVVDCKEVTPAQVIEKGYQPSLYKDYGYIVLNQSGIKPQDVRIIQPSSLKKLIWIFPPKELPGNLKSSDPVELSVNRQTVPSTGGFFSEGKYTLTFLRKGYAPINVGAEVKDNLNRFDFTDSNIVQQQWFKEFDTRNLHFVRDNGTTIESGFSMSSPDAVNSKGQLATSFHYGEVVYIPESRLKDFRLSIQGDKIKRLEKVLDLTKDKVDTIQLTVLKDKVDLQQRIDDNIVAVNIEGATGKNLSREGIVVKDGKIYKLENYLAYNQPEKEIKEEPVDSSKLKKELAKKNQLVKILSIVSGLLVAAFIVFLILFLWKDDEDKDASKTPANTEQNMPGNSVQPSPENQPVINQGATETPQTPDPEFTLPKAIEYLDKGGSLNVNWEKATMEMYPDLQGLFDDMNNYQLDKIVNFWAPLLGKSKNFSDIVVAAKRNISNRYNPRQGEHNPTYNKEGDYKINAMSYRDWIDKDQSSTQKAASTKVKTETTQKPKTQPEKEPDMQNFN